MVGERNSLKLMMMLPRFLRMVVPAAALMLAALGAAQPLDPVQWTGTVEPSTPHPGSKAQLVLHATIQKGWHLYSTTPVEDGPFPSQVELTKGPAIAETGKVAQGEPIKKLDPNFGKKVEFYEGEAEFRVPFRFAKAASGDVSIEGKVTYQTCDDHSCLPPKTKSVSAKVMVSGAAVDDSGPLTATVAPKAAASQKQESAAPNAVERAKKQGLLAYLALAIGSGFLALLTPCVFPMIPITVSFFSKRKRDEGIRGALGQATAYCIGIIATFTAIGVVVAALFGATGVQAFANNPWLNLTLAVVFVALSFSLFGFFELAIPSSILTKIDSGGKAGFLGPVLMGLTFSLTSFTCTLPFVGAVLFSASQGDVLWPVVGMIAFSTAFCLPFFFLALFPAALSKLPKSGAWLATTKAFMGFIELAAAVKFISSVDLGIVAGGLGFVTREVFLALWFGISFVAGLYMLGIVRLPKVDEGSKLGPLRLGIGALTLIGSVYVLMAINGRSLGELEAFLPPSPYPGHTGTSTDSLTWLTSYDEASAMAKSQNKPLFIDFTGVYCTNCRAMEKNMFPRPEVEKRLKDFVRVKLFTDRLTPEDKKNQDLMKSLTNSVALPGYVTMSTSGQVGAAAYTNDEQEFVSFLNHGLGSLSAKR